MIGAIGGYDSIFSIGYSARAAAARTDFSIPESALTTPEAESVSSAQPYDPIQDSVELSRDYPQLVVGQTYAPPMEQQVAFAIRGAEQPSGMADSSEEADYLNDSNALYTGLDVGAQAEEGEEVAEGQAVSGENGEEEEASVDETGREQTNASGDPLSEEERAQVKELAQTDREVRAHEQAHQSVGGAHAGAMSLGYEQGPDGQRYAVSGEVQIDISAGKTPEETLSKMQQVKAAAMAPANPSAQDYKVAAQATQMEAQARQEMSSSQGVEGGKDGESGEAEGVEGEGEGDESGVQGLGTGEGEGGALSASTASANEGVSASSSSGSSNSSANVSGGVASLRTNNAYAQRYSQMQSASMEPAAQQYQFSSMAGGGMTMPSNYRPINIVA